MNKSNILKPKQYGNPDFLSNNLALVHSQQQSKEKTLTNREREIHKVLQQNTHPSLWGEVIRTAINSGSDAKFRELILEIKSEGSKAPVEMQSIIGKKAWELISKY